ncbi:response regulator [Methylobacterium sp. CCH5-D2]|uniref:response regulator n=1 Tax=Methylobacterium sp. CCH5-D2 TaxID=1768765 RepID=UPI00082B879F|nr:response regulator [Methylobacterium sp. CCH5-D2]
MENSARPSPHCALVVDDDALILMDATSILEDAGFKVIEAGNADEALTVLQEHHASITLLFSDVQMPGSRDGFALARHTAEHWPHITIVIASGQAQPRPHDLPVNARFVSKPFSAEVVRRHLRRVLPDDKLPASLRV